MTIETLTLFFMYSSMINGAILLYWAFFIFLMPDFIYRLQSRWFKISREKYDVILYAFLGLYKLFFIFFSLTPYLVCLILSH